MLKDGEIQRDRLYSRSYASILVILIEKLVAESYEAICKMQPSYEDESIPQLLKEDKLRMALLGCHSFAFGFLLDALGEEALNQESFRENTLYKMLRDDLAKLMFSSADLSGAQEKVLRRVIASTEAYSEKIEELKQENDYRIVGNELCRQSGIEDRRIPILASESFGSVLTVYGPMIKKHSRKYLASPSPKIEELFEHTEWPKPAGGCKGIQSG